MTFRLSAVLVGWVVAGCAAADELPRELRADALGSSTVYGVGATTPFPAVLDELLGPTWIVTNSGVPGDTAAGCLTRWRRSVRPARYDAVVVMCGLNDVLHGGSGLDAARALETILDEARSDGLRAVPVLLQPIKGVGSYDPAMQAELDTLNGALLAYCAAHGLHCVDVYAALDDGSGAMRTEYDSGDHFHVNQAGADLIASLTRDAFP